MPNVCSLEQGTDVVLDLYLIQEDPTWCFYTFSGERADGFFTSVNGINWCVVALSSVRFRNRLFSVAPLCSPSYWLIWVNTSV